MEAALLNLIGVALALAAHAQRADAAFGARQSGATATGRAERDGRAFIASCLEHRVPGLAAIIEHIAAAVWADLKSHDFTPLEASTHLAELTQTITSHRARDRVSVDGAWTGPVDASAAAARRLATSILSDDAAGAHLDVPTHGEILPHSLEALFSSLLSALAANPQAMAAIVRARDAATHASTAAAAVPQDSFLAEQARLAHDTGLSRALIEALVAKQRQAGRLEAEIRVTLVDRIVDAIELLSELMMIADKAGRDDALEAEVLAAAQKIRSGDFLAARHDLTELARRLENGPDPARLDSPGFAFLPALQAARAHLAGLDADWREAAHLYEHAVQAWPREERLHRWNLKLRQARQLVALGMLPGARLTVLCEAAQTFAAAGGLISERDCPLSWAEASLELGALLLLLGNRDSKPERYLAAALHFKPALEVFTREKAIDGWARSQIGLAHALRGQGSFQGDVVILNEAAFAYRASLGILTQAATPELWHEARYCLAEALVRIGEETGEQGPVQEAIDILMPIRDCDGADLPDRVRAIARLALGRAMLFLAEQDFGPQADEVVLSEAVAMLDRALSGDRSSLTALEQARGESALGRAHWMLRASGDRETHIAKAIAAKARASTIYDSLDNVIEAETLEREMDQMQAEARSDANAGSDASIQALAIGAGRQPATHQAHDAA